MPEPILQKKKAGRPSTGVAKSTTERVKKSRHAVEQSGGIVLRTTVLSAEAHQALKVLLRSHKTKRDAIEAALILAAANAD